MKNEILINNKDLKALYDKNILDKKSLENIYLYSDKNSESINILNNKKYKFNSKISVIISTYNRINLLKKCIDSIIAQSYKNFEIIIVDDFSDDLTYDFFQNKSLDSRIKYFRNEKNMGVGYTKKRGYNLISGDYVIFADDDDYFIDQDYFKNIINIFKDEKIKLICCNSLINYEKDNNFIFSEINFKTGLTTHEYLKGLFTKYKKPPIWGGVFRKNILNESKIEDMVMVNDSSIFLRYLLIPGIVYVYDKPVGVYRIPSKKINNNYKLDYKFIYENLLEKYYVYKKINNKIISNKDKWLDDQILITMIYYINSSTIDMRSLNKLIRCIKLNIVNNKFLIAKIYWAYLKSIIKKIIRRK